MSITHVPAALRRLVRERSGLCCEYCRIHESDTGFGCAIDHVIAEKHLGTTDAANLAFACFACNSSKGSDIASLTASGQLTRLFHPRTDVWNDHFLFDQNSGEIVSRTDIGEVTARLLGFNTTERIRERTALQSIGRYPPPRPDTDT